MYLKEDLQNTTCFFIDEAGNTIHSSTTSKTTDGRFGDTLDVVSKNLAMAFGTTFAEAFPTFTACVRVSIESVEDRDNNAKCKCR